MSFDRNALFAMFKPKVVPVTVDVGDDKFEVFVKELSAAQVFDLQKKQKAVKDKDKTDEAANKAFALLLLSEALCDENGEKVMDTAEAQGLLSMKVAAFNRITEVVAEAVGLGGNKEEGKAA